MVWLLNGLLNLDSSSEVLHIMRKFGIEPFHWIKLYNLIYDYLSYLNWNYVCTYYQRQD
jgi:hypothetical protein